ncbi:uncharacterized protein LOC130900678 [Diorhabda carinulata]|uniref:uncharacterized protein LOC130900678 n=1 Tax=Diorhabda carinulata TaxID=1163345 RepID=UPI0025A1F788|nr:uncharacterized protein LOC130900678 [Diorhabda carinulata]
MKSFIVLALCLAISAAIPLDIVEDEEGQEYLIVPLHRERREVKVGASQSGVNVGHSSSYGNGPHRVDTAVGASKSWGSHGIKPDSFGGSVSYSHTPSGSSAFAGANRAPGYGTDVSAGGRYNFAGGKNWNAGVSAGYNRHFGGPGGTGKPQASVGLGVNGRF